MTGREWIIHQLGAGAAVFVLAYGSSALFPNVSPKAALTICAAIAFLAGYATWRPENGDNRLFRRVLSIICICIAGGLAMMAVSPSGDISSMGLRLTLAIGVMLFFARELTTLTAPLYRVRDDAVFAGLATIGLAAGAPLWIGPWVEYFSGLAWFADILVAVSPLTYFAVMAEYDYLRDQWFYTHAPYGAFRFDYPGQFVSSVVYFTAGIACRVWARSLGHWTRL